MAEMNFSSPLNASNFLTSCRPFSFSSSVLLRRIRLWLLLL